MAFSSKLWNKDLYGRQRLACIKYYFLLKLLFKFFYEINSCRTEATLLLVTELLYFITILQPQSTYICFAASFLSLIRTLRTVSSVFWGRSLCHASSLMITNTRNQRQIQSQDLFLEITRFRETEIDKTEAVQGEEIFTT